MRQFIARSKKANIDEEALTRPLATLSHKERVTVSLLPGGEG
jgi:hypothetical protein